MRGDDGMISEMSITPAEDLPTLADVKTEVADDKIQAVRADRVFAGRIHGDAARFRMSAVFTFNPRAPLSVIEQR